jgi:hypothetical protein
LFVLIDLECTELSVIWRALDLGPLPALFTVGGQADRRPDALTGRLVTPGLIDLVAQAAIVFGQSSFDVALRDSGRPGRRSAVAFLDDVAFLAVVADGHVRFRRLPADTALTALVTQLPAAPPAKGTTITLPLAVADAAITRSMEFDSADPDTALVDCLVDRGLAPADAGLFAALADGERLRSAEFGVTYRGRTGRRRCVPTVRVADTPHGRSVLYPTGDYLVSAPADEPTVVRALTAVCDAELGSLGGKRLG